MEILKDHQYVVTVVGKVAEEQGIKNYLITDVIQNQKGEGYASLFLTAKVKDTNSDKELDLAIKVAFTDDKVRKMVPIKVAFENEIYFYSKVYPAIKQLEENCGITPSAEFVPKFFKGSIEDTREMLILENLKVVNFQLFDKKSFLDHDHVSLIFKTYGRFHAYSFALREQKPEEFSEIVKGCYNMFVDLFKDEENFFKELLRNCGKKAIEHLKPEDDKIKNKLEELYSGEKYCEIFKDLTTENCPFSVILHGDCWSNNMMFKYEKLKRIKISCSGAFDNVITMHLPPILWRNKTANEKKLVDLRLLDWQVMKIGSPVCDLSYCFYSGASEEVLDSLDQYLKIYHDSLSSYLRQLGCDPEKLFPFNALKEEWKKFAKFGMMMGLCVWKVKMSEDEDIREFTDGMDSVDDFSNAICNAKFNEKGYSSITRKIFYHLYEIGAL